MKKFIRKLTALTLALCLVCACAITVSAKSDYSSGTYNGQGYGTTDSCETDKFYSETGSSSDYSLTVQVTFYYYSNAGTSIYGGNVSSGPKTRSVSISGSEQIYAYHHIVGVHKVNGTVVYTGTAYSA